MQSNNKTNKQDELNVTDVIYTEDVSAFASYSFKPEKRALGKKYGRYLKQIGDMLQSIDGNTAMTELNETGMLKLDLGDITAEIKKEELLISAAKMEGFESLSDNGVTVVLDTNLTPELIEEGNVREIVSKIQTMRKDSGFEVMDNINIYVSGNTKVVAIAEKNAAEIMGETLGKSLTNAENENAKEWDINGETVTLSVTKQ